MGPVAGAIIGALLYVLLPGVANEVNQSWGTNIRQRAETLAAKIYKKLMANSKTKDKLIEAYQNKNNNLLSSLINQAGYSVQASALQKEIKEAKEKYLNKNDELTDKNTNLTNLYNKVVNAGNMAGSSIAANVSGEDTIKNVSKLVDGGVEN